MKQKIIPTLISSNQEEFDANFEKIKDVSDTIQLDVMDGRFVVNRSNWFKFELPKNKKYEAHLMINNPEMWVLNHIKDVDLFLLNIERTKNPYEIIEYVKKYKRKIGFALNPETSIEKIRPHLKNLDQVLILTVNPGRYGAKFIPAIIKKVKELRKIYKGDIEVDGHVNPSTIRKLSEAGANVFAVGNYFHESTDISKSLEELKKALNKKK